MAMSCSNIVSGELSSMEISLSRSLTFTRSVSGELSSMEITVMVIPERHKRLIMFQENLVVWKFRSFYINRFYIINSFRRT